MNPNIAAAQIRNAAMRRELAALAPRVAYSTTTGDAPRVEVPAAPAQGPNAWWVEAHCFVCGRHTDHFAEHDELVEAGLAEYDAASGSVFRTEAWDADKAREVAEIAFLAWKRELDLAQVAA